MRNFKKVMALVLAIALTLSTFTVSFAAEAEAGKLVDLGLLLKTDDLDNTLTRKVGIAVVLKALGFTQEDQDATELTSTFTDTEEWYAGFAAIAVDLGVTNGVSETEFGGELVLTQKMFVTWMLRALGYDVTAEIYADDAALTALAVEAGLAEEIVDGEFTKGAAVEIMFAALSAEMQDESGLTLIETLIAAGEVTREAAIEAGLVDATPEELLVTSIEVLNLKQIQVNFNKAVDESGDEDNYEVDGETFIDADSDFDLSDDAMSVVVTMTDAADNQESYDIIVDGVVAVDGDELEEVTFEAVEFLDTTLPVVLSAEVVGIDTIKVIFSEPMNTTTGDNDINPVTETANFEVNDDDIIVKEVTAQSNNTEVLVELYSELEEGEVTIQVSDCEDYAGYTAITKSFTVEVVEDTEAPTVIGYEDADQNSIVLIWSEDIEEADFDDAVYHTNTNHYAAEADVTIVNGNEMEIIFDDDDMPNGTAYIYVLAETVNDFWDNENAKQVVTVETTIDETAPAVSDTDVVFENAAGLDWYALEVTFDEEIMLDTPSTDLNSLELTLLDEDGDEVTDVRMTSTIIDEDSDDNDNTILEVTFADDDFEEGTYTLVIEEGLYDLVENEVVGVSVDFTVEDGVSPEDGAFSATVYNSGDDDQLVVVDFDEAMAIDGTYSVLDIDKWEIDNVPLSDYEDDIDFTVINDGSAVEIEIPADVDTPAFDITSGSVITLARVADAAGNKTAIINSIDIVGESAVTVDDVYATDVNTIVVEFSDYLATFDKSEFVITTGTATHDSVTNGDELTVTKVKTAIDSDGETVATFTVDEALDFNGFYLGNDVFVVIADATNDADAAIDSENSYGESVAAYALNNADVLVADDITPALRVDEDDDVDYVYYAADKIYLVFEEAMDQDTITRKSFEVKGGDIAVDSVTFADGNTTDGYKTVILNLNTTDIVDQFDTDYMEADFEGVNVEQISAIEDANGNDVTGITTEVVDAADYTWVY